MTLAALEIASTIDPYVESLPVGVEVPTIDAVGWTRGHRSVDVRPRLVDSRVSVIFNDLSPTHGRLLISPQNDIPKDLRSKMSLEVA